MVVWVSHARVGHRQGFIPEAPSKRWGLLLCTDTPCVQRRRLNATGRQLPGAGWSSLAARRAHNPKVAGSNPAPATNMYPQAAAPRGRRFALGEPATSPRFCVAQRFGVQSPTRRRLDVKKRFSEEQIIGFLREAEAGLPVKELCRKHGFSEASYYLWRSKFGGMSVPDAKRLKELEAENGRLKKLLAEQVLENE